MKKILCLMVGACCVLPMTIEPIQADGKSVNVGYSVDAKVTFLDEGVTIEADVKCGQAMKEPSHIDKKGYKFLGWYIKGTDTKWDFSQAVTGDLSLETRFEKETIPTPVDPDDSKKDDEDKKDDKGDSDKKDDSSKDDDSKKDDSSDTDKDTDKDDSKSDDKKTDIDTSDKNDSKIDSNTNTGSKDNENKVVVKQDTSTKNGKSVNTATPLYVIPFVLTMGISLICLFLIKKKEEEC